MLDSLSYPSHFSFFFCQSSKIRRIAQAKVAELLVLHFAMCPNVVKRGFYAVMLLPFSFRGIRIKLASCANHGFSLSPLPHRIEGLSESGPVILSTFRAPWADCREKITENGQSAGMGVKANEDSKGTLCLQFRRYMTQTSLSEIVSNHAALLISILSSNGERDTAKVSSRWKF